MTAVIFAGPTIQAAELSALTDAQISPPAAMGDVRRAVSGGPSAIGIIDGYFEGVPSVWHKEILWALEQGVPVFGAASMGALRAAELHSFGMIGVGRIFEAYQSGEIEDDDEVAVHHGPAETGYLPLSEPMVNIRATLEHAVDCDVVDKAVANDIASLAKDMVYPDRNWDDIAKQAEQRGTDPVICRALMDWLPNGRVDQKRADAIAMVAAMKDHLSANRAWTRPDFDLEWTVMWDRAMRIAEPTADTGGLPPVEDLILDQLRLDPGDFRAIRRKAAARLLADRQNLQGRPTKDTAALTRFRTEHRLFSKKALDAWLIDNDLEEGELHALLQSEERLTAIMADGTTALREQMLHELRLAGRYQAFAAQAHQTLQCLRRREKADPSSADLTISIIELIAWYFEQRLEMPIPEDLDRFIEDMGFPSRAAFEQMVTRQYLSAQ